MRVRICYNGLRDRGAKIAKIFDLFLKGHEISISDVTTQLECSSGSEYVFCKFCLPQKGCYTDHDPSESCHLPIDNPTPANFVLWMNQRRPEDLALMRRVVAAFRGYHSKSDSSDLLYALASCSDEKELQEIISKYTANRRNSGCFGSLMLLVAVTILVITSL